MNRLARLLSLSLLLLSPTSLRATGTLAVVVAGASWEPIASYKADGETYVDAKSVGEICSGQVYWYPVSGRVQLSVRGRTMQFLIGSKQAAAGTETFTMTAAAIVRASRAYLPVSFLSSEAFGHWSGLDIRFDATTRTLQIERRSTAGPARSFSYKDRTRIAFDLGPGVSYQASARGIGAMEILVPFGVIDGDDKVDIDDDIVASYIVKQEAHQARLTIRFTQNGSRWKVTEIDSPRRVVVDVYAPGTSPSPEAPSTADMKPDVRAPAETVPPKAVLVGTATPSAPAIALEHKQRVVVVDAGHGGKDPGATGVRGLKEKNVTLASALELARVLRERGDFKVVLTREDDTFVPLSDRSKAANDIDADLFVSLHCNASGNSRETGFEVYSVSERATDPEAEALAAAENAALELEGKKPEEEAAKLILLAMTKTEMVNESAPFAALVERAIGKRVSISNRGVKQAGFYVLRGTHAPAILVEMAFVSHAKDEAALGSRRFRRKMAEGVAAGIADYARKKRWLE